MPPKKKHFKVECLFSHATFDSDYRRKHNELCHDDHLKAHKLIGYKVAGVPSNPFEVRLFNLILLNCEKDITDSIDLNCLVNKWSTKNKRLI